MAEAAVRALVGADRAEPPRHQVFPTRLLVRQSCGCG
jgi:LacI family transcriptional regulator